MTTPNATVLDILRALSPFDVVPEGLLLSVEDAICVKHYASGSTILAGGAPSCDLLVVMDGTVEVRSDSGNAVTLVPFEAFPLEALQGRKAACRSGNGYVAASDASVIAIPAEAIAALRTSCREFDDFCERRSDIGMQSGFGNQSDISSRNALNMDLARLLPNRQAATLPPTATIEDVVQELHNANTSEVVLVDTGIPVGIFTRSDLISRVLVPKISFNTPVSDVMSPKLVTLPASALGFNAVIEMHRRGVSHIVLTDDNHHFVGVISDSDLLYALQDSTDLHNLIARSRSEEDLVRAAAKIRNLAVGLIGQGIETEHLTKLISTLNDQLAERIIDITAERYKIPADRFCWLALGSEGRHEQTLHTDQDNGLIFVCDDPDLLEDTRLSMTAFAKDVNAILDKCGFPFCSGNIMASNPECCLTLSEWRQRFGEWINEPTPVALLNATIYFDLRPLCGNRGLCDELINWMLKAVRSNKRFFHFMTANALQRKPPISLFRDFIVDKSDSCLDLKLSGLALLVDGARILGLAAGCISSSTVERLRAAEEHKLILSEQVADLIASFDIIQRIRLRHHHAQWLQDAPLSNRINPFELNMVDRRGFMEALRRANTLQKEIDLKYNMERRR